MISAVWRWEAGWSCWDKTNGTWNPHTWLKAVNTQGQKGSSTCYDPASCYSIPTVTGTTHHRGIISSTNGHSAIKPSRRNQPTKSSWPCVDIIVTAAQPQSLWSAADDSDPTSVHSSADGEKLQNNTIHSSCVNKTWLQDKTQYRLKLQPKLELFSVGAFP